jgi:plasmid stabilization system protein ParE
MTDNDSDNQQEQYEQSLGLASETTMINLYPSKQQVQKWGEEAEDNNFRNRNQYLISLIEEARAYRENELRGPRQAEQRIQDLQSEVDRLQTQLEQERKKGGGRPAVDDINFLERFLDTNYKSLEQILQEIVESGALNDLLRKRVEDQLYFMASREEVEFERGWGWKLTDHGGDD